MKIHTGTGFSDARETGHEAALSGEKRALIFGSNTPEEPRRLQAETGTIPAFGFYCCGEFARTSGVLGTHSATLTAIAL